MAAGKPTLLAIDGVIRDVVEKAGGGIFSPPGDAIKLASRIMGLYEDPRLCKTMGKNAKEYVKKHFDRKQQAEQFYSLLHHMVS